MLERIKNPNSKMLCGLGICCVLLAGILVFVGVQDSLFSEEHSVNQYVLRRNAG